MTPWTRTAHHHQFELTNHLGNVSVIVSNNKLLSAIQSQKLYLPDVLEYQEYYPFGMVMNDRKGSYNAQDYRYGYNGKENDNEVKGESNQQDYGFRVYDPRVGRFLSVDPLAEMYPSLSPYNFVANNPLIYIDPDGGTIIPVHGTWSDKDTWKDLGGISRATINLFGDYVLGTSYPWTGGNYAQSRTDAALGLINHVRGEITKEYFNGQITLVGHSHGGNVSIEALNMMAEMKEFDNVQLNLLSINTPVREDYQLSEKAVGRVNHVNVYDPKDPVQANGGNSVIVSPREGNPTPSGKGWGEYGPANRIFDCAKNIRVNNPQGVLQFKPMPFMMPPRVEMGDFHNSHNRVNDWIKETEKKMRNLIFILLMYVFSSCNDCNYKITELVKARVKFIDLPQRVQNFYQNSSEFGQDNPSLIKFACLDTDSNFTLETIETWYGPWVDYYELIDQAKQLSYRIDQGTPIPIVVYDNKLYLVDKFNMFTNLKEYSSLEFTRYDLR